MHHIDDAEGVLSGWKQSGLNQTDYAKRLGVSRREVTRKISLAKNLDSEAKSIVRNQAWATVKVLETLARLPFDEQRREVQRLIELAPKNGNEALLLLNVPPRAVETPRRDVVRAAYERRWNGRGKKPADCVTDEDLAALQAILTFPEFGPGDLAKHFHIRWNALRNAAKLLDLPSRPTDFDSANGDPPGVIDVELVRWLQRRAWGVHIALDELKARQCVWLASGQKEALEQALTEAEFVGIAPKRPMATGSKWKDQWRFKPRMALVYRLWSHPTQRKKYATIAGRFIAEREIRLV